MKKNKLTELLFTNKWNEYPNNTCKLISNFIGNILNYLVALLAILTLTPILLSPLTLLIPGVPMFPTENDKTLAEFFGHIGSVLLVVYCAISIILLVVFLWNKTENVTFVRNIISSIRNKTCFKVEWKE